VGDGPALYYDPVSIVANATIHMVGQSQARRRTHSSGFLPVRLPPTLCRSATFDPELGA
jgi:hypothetical protein